MAIRTRWFFPAIGAGVICACGGAASSGGAVAAVPSNEVAPAGSGQSKVVGSTAHLREIAGAKVYDAHGVSGACALPRDDCPEALPDRAFLDHCRLASFQVRRCGCEDRCSGDVSAAGRYYDAVGSAKECAPARDDCGAAQAASASFQDACAERGHHLATCGCEWLCSGNPTR